ncbi:MAG TPA: cold-shock protein, partial [Desulfovibrio sp.]|nr:cold-shock protein [Desulfovibrio sp.]
MHIHRLAGILRAGRVWRGRRPRVRHKGVVSWFDERKGFGFIT